MNTDIEFVQKFNLAYNAMCKPLCQQRLAHGVVSHVQASVPTVKAAADSF